MRLCLLQQCIYRSGLKPGAFDSRRVHACACSPRNLDYYFAERLSIMAVCMSVCVCVRACVHMRAHWFYTWTDTHS